MPLIPIYLSAEHIINLHENLIQVYQEEPFPTKIEPGFNYRGAIDNICFIVSTDKYYPFKHFLERAAYLFYYLNRSHPFMDGNKRTALLTTFYFLMWNGYFLDIPQDAHKLILAIADANREDVTMEHAYNWILENIARGFVSTIIMCMFHLVIVVSLSIIGFLTRKSKQDLLAQLLYALKIKEIMDHLVERTGLNKIKYRK